MKTTFPKGVLVLILLYAYTSSFLLYAEPNIEKATNEVDRAGRKAIEQRLITVPAKPPPKVLMEEAPTVEGERKTFVKRIELVGCEAYPKEKFQPLISKYEGREVSFSELDFLTKKIAAEYGKSGVVANAFLSPRETKDGVFTIRIVEARMGKLSIEGNRYFNNKNLTRYWIIARGEVLRYDKISRCVQTMNKNPDREVKAVLRPGSEPGTTDVLLVSTTRFPAHSTYNIDNDGANYTGTIRQTVGGRHNNLLGLDDMFMSGYSFGEHFSGTYIYHNIPISPFGTSLLYGYSHSTAAPQGDFAPYDMRAMTDVTRGSIHQDIYNGGKYLGEIYSEFEANDKTITAYTGTLNRDRLRMLNIGGNFLKRKPSSITYFMPEYTQGLGMAFGASPESNPYASNLAKPIFSKFSISAYHREMLPLDIQEIVKLKAQYSPAKLTPQEQLGFGGMNSIRGYSPGDYYADNGVLANLELLFPSVILPKTLKLPFAEKPLRDDLKGLIFLDYGYGNQRDEDKSHSFLSAGAGLRIRLYDQASIRIEWGCPMWGEHSESRFYFSVDFQDKLPEEFARIVKALKKEKTE